MSLKGMEVAVLSGLRKTGAQSLAYSAALEITQELSSSRRASARFDLSVIWSK
jgi:hypothetical protein